MNIRSILALIDGGPNSRCALTAAIRVGQAFDAHVEVLHVEQPIGPIVPMLPMAGTDTMIDAFEHDAKQRTAKADSLFQELCVNAGLRVIDPEDSQTDGCTFSWRLVSGHDNPELARRGRLCDLVVMARADEANGGVDSAILEAALFDTGRPVLIAGEQSLDYRHCRCAIAWDGSREAAQSIGSALPFLAQAGEVVILSVVDKAPVADADGLLNYLQRHEISGQAVIVKRSGRSIASALKSEIDSRHIDLVIMGAYGHSPIEEFIFGGVTRDMLTEDQIPLLLAH